jgi:DNA invertase Pin-like site-specific DNA recombinase
MTYGYLRVSTDEQDENNQRVGVDKKAQSMQVKINEYIIDKVSGTKEPEKRELGKLMQKLKPGDLIIASEISRLGRSMYMVMRILEFCMKNEIKVVTVKDNYELGDNIQSKVLAFAFSLAAEIERNMISQRTKEALRKKMSEGIIVGRPNGRKNKTVLLTGKEKEIKILLECGESKVSIARKMGVSRNTLHTFIVINNLSTKTKNTNPQSQSKVEEKIGSNGMMEFIKMGKTVKEISKLIGICIPTLNLYLRSNSKLHKLYEKVQDKIRIEKNGGLHINKRHRGE